jgi:hypothetical protein
LFFDGASYLDKQERREAGIDLWETDMLCRVRDVVATLKSSGQRRSIFRNPITLR